VEFKKDPSGKISEIARRATWRRHRRQEKILIMLPAAIHLAWVDCFVFAWNLTNFNP